MIKIAEAINSFAHEAEQAHVPTTKPIFVLTGPQLQEVIQEATRPLRMRLDQLESKISPIG